MAVTETVKIVFEADTGGVTDSINDLVKLKKITQEEADALKKLGDEAKKAGDGLDGLGDNAKKAGDGLGGLGDNAGDAGEKFVSLKARLREAKLEVQQLSESSNGKLTPALDSAIKKAGALADEMDDLNRAIKLSNPEGKAQAFVNFGNKITGAFQIATGALQAFGAENEEVQKIATKLQGALNIAQGIASIKELKESYQDIKIVLGLTTAAQTTLTGATTTGAAATTGASAALRGFAASLSATGIGAIVVALGALVGAMIALGSETDETAKKSERLLEIEAERAKLAGDEVAASRALKVLKGELTEDAAKRLETEDEINKQIAKTSSDLAKLITNNKAIIQQYQTFAEQGREQEFFAAFSDEAGDVIRQYFALQQNLVQLKKTAVKELQVIDEQANQNKKKADEKADDEAKARREKAITEALRLLAEEQKVRADSLALNQLYEATEEDILRQKLFNNEADQEGLRLILSKAQGTNQYDGIQSQINEKVREEIALRKELANTLEIPLIPLKNQLEGQKDINKELEKLGPIAVKVNSEWKGSSQEGFEREEKLAQKERERIDRAFQIANQVSEIFIDEVNRRNEEEIAALERQKEQGLISEEQYQLKLRKLKQNAAEENKKAQIFQATMSAAQAILSALAIVADPATKTAAVAFAATVGALNLAKIIATPIPKFKKGTLAVPGTDTGQDSVFAMLRPGEAVIPTETNREYAPVIRAIYRRDINAKELNDFVTNRDQGAFAFNQVSLDALYKRDLKVSALTQAGRSEQLTNQPTRITADVDVQQLSRAMSKNKAVEVTNTAALGEAIAAQLSKRINPRQVI